jgi:brefeldin A-inhibited guanine nucleotide-exchange protein
MNCIIYYIFFFLRQASDIKSQAIRSKLFSLDLLLAILNDDVDEVLQTSELFIVAVKYYLMVSLTRNSVSTIMSVAELSMKILLRVIQLFRHNLKVKLATTEIKLLFLF